MKLYYAPGTCALSVHIALIWLEQPYELFEVELGSEAYKKINPTGAVPALIDGDSGVMSQAHAILGYLGGKYSHGNMSGNTLLERQAFDQWMAFLTGDLHPAYAPIFAAQRFTTQTDEAALGSVQLAANARVKNMFTILDEHLEGKDFLLFDRRTFADSYAYVMTKWLHYASLDVAQFPNLKRHFDRLQNDAAVIQAETEQGIRDA